MMGEVIANELKRLEHTMVGIFALVPLADQAMKDVGLTEEEQHDIFMALSPEGGFAQLDPRVYAAHVAELCARWKAGESLDPATKMDAMMALSETSLKAPLGQQAGALYERLFIEVFGEDATDPVYSEPWEGASDELLAQMRQRFARVRASRG